MSAPRRLVITGAAGLIGFHLRARAHGLEGFETIPLDRAAFNRVDSEASEATTGPTLGRALTDADAVVHLAGMNRGDDHELESTNIDLARRLIDALDANDRKPHLVFASSTHRDRDTAYGRSKRRSHELFSDWAEATGTPYTELVLPNVFGEGGRPFHNSAVSTFCHQIAHGETPNLLVDRELPWLHAQGAAATAIGAIESSTTGSLVVPGTVMKVSELLARLEALAARYAEGVLPVCESDFDRDLFNTYRSYLPAGTFPRTITAHSDDRGRLVEAVKSDAGGQCFFSTSRPGVLRGGHYHRHKFERFLVVEGRARIRIRRLFDDHVTEHFVDGSRPAYVDMPTFHTHDLCNVGDDTLLTLFWADEIFDPEATDTYFEPVAA